jgi:hypothetical protein
MNCIHYNYNIGDEVKLAKRTADFILEELSEEEKKKLREML